MAAKHKSILARLNFPLFTIQMLTNRHVIVGGGGGSSKTGVANGFEIFELAHDGKKFMVEEVTRHETGRCVVMNCSVFNDNKHVYLVAGQDNYCQLYNVKSTLVTKEHVENIDGHTNNHVRQRKASLNEKTDNNRNSKRIKFVITPVDGVETDRDLPQPLMNVSRINHTGKLLATGGTDGVVKLWHFPNLKPKCTFKSHSKEIDDVDFSYFNNYLVSVSKDGQAILWDYNRGKEVKRLTWKQPEGSKYLYKRCRFGIVEGDDKKDVLYMLSNPTAKKQKSYLQQWLPEVGILKKFAKFDENLSALAVRDDGRFVAVGTMSSGSVEIYIAFSLQRVLNIPTAHSMFITGLEFLPVLNNYTVTSAAEAAVLSISVDNHVCIHSLPYRRSMPAFIGILIIILTLFMTFMFCSYVGL